MVKTTPFSYISVTIWMHFLHTETSMTIVFVLSTIILPNPRNYNWEPDITFCHQFNDQNLQKLIEHVYLKFNVSSNFLRILETLQSQLCCSLLAFFSSTHTLYRHRGISTKPSFRRGREIECLFCSNLSTVCFHKT